MFRVLAAGQPAAGLPPRPPPFRRTYEHPVNAMSKLIKDMICKDLQRRLSGVEDALLVSMAGLTSDKTFELRKHFRSKNVHVLVVKNSLARRAAEGTPLAAAFEQMEGSLAVVWGDQDLVSLAKVVIEAAQNKKFEPFQAKGGVMDGQRLTAQQVEEVSKWPSREEVLSLLVGQILGPGARLAGQLAGPGGALASQVKQQGEEAEEEPAAAPA